MTDHRCRFERGEAGVGRCFASLPSAVSTMTWSAQQGRVAATALLLPLGLEYGCSAGTGEQLTGWRDGSAGSIGQRSECRTRWKRVGITCMRNRG